MDGFNVIAVDKDPNQNNNSSGPNFGANSPIVLDGVEIIDEEKEKEKSKPSGYESWLFFFAVFSLVIAICYFIFLVVYRVILIDQIVAYSERLQVEEKKLNLEEIQEFRSMDNTLSSINTRLKNHVLLSEVFITLNSNLRKTLQVSEFRVQVNQNDVTADVSAVAPSFKELAEQTEKLFSMKEKGEIKSFSVTGLSFEQNTKRVKFSIKTTFDKSRVSVRMSAPKVETASSTNP